MTIVRTYVVYLRRLKRGVPVEFVSRIAADGALVVSYHPSCVEFFPRFVEVPVIVPDAPAK